MALHSRPQRLAEEIKVALADILQNELKDPRFTLALLTVTHVDVSGDLRHATAHISVYAGDEETRQIMEGLNHSRSFIKRQVGERVVVKYMPDIHFRLDETGRNADRINRLLKQIEKTQPERTPDDESEPKS